MPRTRRQLEILNAIAEALNSAPQVQVAIERTLALVADLLGLKSGWVWLVDPESQHFYAAAAQDLPPYLQQPVRMSGVSCWCIEQFRGGQRDATNIDVMECSRLRPAVRAKQTELTHGLAYHATIPLYFQDKPLGIMNITGPKWRRLTSEELKLLSTIAYQVGVAIERARLAEESARLARSEERTRIAREIHDTLAQSLTAIALQIESAMRELGGDPERARERLDRALATARQSLDDARRSVIDLRAAPLDGKPLPQALAALARELTSESGVRVTLDTRCERPLKPEMEAELYRIAQEALTNVRKHAQATHVDLSLTCGADSIELVVHDDGRGFDARDFPGDRHGIVGMRERARILGGTLAISGQGGTRVAVTVPA